MTKTITMKNFLAFFFALAMLMALTAWGAAVLFGPRVADASAPAGAWATVATTSLATPGPLNAVYLMGTTSREQNYTCSSRIISTGADGIRLSFASLSSTTLSRTVGHFQAASTTQVYDGGLYGCGYWTAFGFGASTTITISELR